MTTCPSCRAVSATTDDAALRAELLRLALEAGAVRWEPYPEAVGWEQMKRDADARLCRWLRSPLGVLLLEVLE